MQGKEELIYLKRISKFPDQVLEASEESKQEGFEYLFEKLSIEAGSGKLGRLGILLKLGVGGSFLGRFKVMSIFARQRRGMMKGISQCFNDLNQYIDQLFLDSLLEHIHF